MKIFLFLTVLIFNWLLFGQTPGGVNSDGLELWLKTNEKKSFIESRSKSSDKSEFLNSSTETDNSILWNYNLPLNSREFLCKEVNELGFRDFANTLDYANYFCVTKLIPSNQDIDFLESLNYDSLKHLPSDPRFRITYPLLSTLEIVTNLSCHYSINGNRGVSFNFKDTMFKSDFRKQQLEKSQSISQWFAEYIVFSRILTHTERAKINSYLALKYGVTLDNSEGKEHGDYLLSSGKTVWDASVSVEFHNMVIGIVRDDASGLCQKQSQSPKDDFRIYIGSLSNTNMENKLYLVQNLSAVIVGNNEKNVCFSKSSLGKVSNSTPNLVISDQIDRVWKITKTNFAQNFNMDIMIESCASVVDLDSNKIVLMVDDDGNFSNGGTKYFYNGDNSGIIIQYNEPAIRITNISSNQIVNNSTLYLSVGLK